jgi:hypothetical protein
MDLVCKSIYEALKYEWSDKPYSGFSRREKILNLLLESLDQNDWDVKEFPSKAILTNIFQIFL